MLFHYLKDQDGEQYFEQLSLIILGKSLKSIFRIVKMIMVEIEIRIQLK